MQLAQVISKKSASKKLAREVAAYLLDARTTCELDPLLRDVWADYADQGYMEVIAVSAHPLEPKALSDIKLKIRKLYPNAKQIIVTPQLDPSMLVVSGWNFPQRPTRPNRSQPIDPFKQLTTAGKNEANL